MKCKVIAVDGATVGSGAQWILVPETCFILGFSFLFFLCTYSVWWIPAEKEKREEEEK